MKKMIFGAVMISAVLAMPAVAEGPVKEPSLVEQVNTLTNQLAVVQGQLDEANLEIARMQARYRSVVNLYNAKAKKYKFSQLKG